MLFTIMNYRKNYLICSGAITFKYFHMFFGGRYKCGTERLDMLKQARALASSHEDCDVITMRYATYEPTLIQNTSDSELKTLRCLFLPSDM